MVWPTGCRPKGDGVIQIRWGTPPNRQSENLRLPHTEAGKREAARVRARRIQDYKYGKPATPSASLRDSPRFFDAAQRWLRIMQKEKDWSSATYDSYRNALNRYWIPRFGDEFVDQVSFNDVDEYWESLAFSTKKTAKNVLSPFKGVCTYCYRKQWTTEDLGARLHVVAAQAPEIDPFSWDELERIVEQLRQMAAEDEKYVTAYVYWIVAIDTGMRTPSEICALTWSDFDGRKFRVKADIVRRKNQNRTKTKKARDVYVTRRVKGILQRHPTRWTNKGGHIFLNGAGTQIKDADELNKAFYQACDRARVRRRRPYNTRHSWATRSQMMKPPMRPARAAKHLGHSLETFMRRYQSWIDSEQDQDDILQMETHYENGPEVGLSGSESEDIS